VVAEVVRNLGRKGLKLFPTGAKNGLSVAKEGTVCSRRWWPRASAVRAHRLQFTADQLKGQGAPLDGSCSHRQSRTATVSRDQARAAPTWALLTTNS